MKSCVFTIAPATACTRLSYENTSRSFRSLEPILGKRCNCKVTFFILISYKANNIISEFRFVRAPEKRFPCERPLPGPI